MLMAKSARSAESQPAQFARFSLVWVLCKRFQNCKKIPRQRRRGESRTGQICGAVVCRFSTKKAIFAPRKTVVKAGARWSSSSRSSARCAFVGPGGGARLRAPRHGVLLRVPAVELVFALLGAVCCCGSRQWSSTTITGILHWRTTKP